MVRSFGTKTLAVILSVVMLMTACSTNWVTQAEQVIAIALPIATNILTIASAFSGKSVDPTQVAKVKSVTDQITNDLNTAEVLLQNYNSANAQTTVQKVNAALADVKDNLQVILTGLDIKDQDLKNRITAIAGLVLSSVQTIENVLPAVAGGTVSASAKANAAKMTPEVLKARYNALAKTPTGNPDLDQVSASTVLK